MRPTNTIWTAALILSGLALLSFLTRTLIDYRFVFAELPLPVTSGGRYDGHRRQLGLHAARHGR
jgi:hypothetical protein